MFSFHQRAATSGAGAGGAGAQFGQGGVDWGKIITWSNVAWGMILFFSFGTVGMWMYGIQSQLSNNFYVNLGCTGITVIMTPMLASLYIPLTPQARLMRQMIKGMHWGYAAMTLVECYLLYYLFILQRGWWMQQTEGAVRYNLVNQQVILVMIGHIFLPAIMIPFYNRVQTMAMAEAQANIELYQELRMQKFQMVIARYQNAMHLLGKQMHERLSDHEIHQLAAIQEEINQGIEMTRMEAIYAFDQMLGAGPGVMSAFTTRNPKRLMARMERIQGAYMGQAGGGRSTGRHQRSDQYVPVGARGGGIRQYAPVAHQRGYAGDDDDGELD